MTGAKSGTSGYPEVELICPAKLAPRALPDVTALPVETGVGDWAMPLAGESRLLFFGERGC